MSTHPTWVLPPLMHPPHPPPKRKERATAIIKAKADRAKHDFVVPFAQIPHTCFWPLSFWRLVFSLFLMAWAPMGKWFWDHILLQLRKLQRSSKS
jgi:hypothetical protein